VKTLTDRLLAHRQVLRPTASGRQTELTASKTSRPAETGPAGSYG